MISLAGSDRNVFISGPPWLKSPLSFGISADSTKRDRQALSARRLHPCGRKRVAHQRVEYQYANRHTAAVRAVARLRLPGKIVNTTTAEVFNRRPAEPASFVPL